MRKFDFEKNSIVEIVNDIIVESVEIGASDIHFDPTPTNFVLMVNFMIIPKSLIF